jgi:membrane dipeptidase
MVVVFTAGEVFETQAQRFVKMTDYILPAAIQNLSGLKDLTGLHEQAIVIDGHCDILAPIADGKARLADRVSVPDPETWQPPIGIMGLARGDAGEFSPHTFYFGPIGQYSLPQLRAGGVTVQTCAIFIDDHHLDRALQRGLEMAWWFHREIADNPDFEIVTSVADIHRLKREGKVGGILSFEGFEPIGTDLRLLDIFHRLGLRMASLTHSRRNAFADGMQFNVETGGLTALGRAAVRRMNELGIVIDLAHLNARGMWDVLELSRDPVIMSHGRPRKGFPLKPADSAWHPALDVSRGRERLEALARNGGVIGVIFYNQSSLDEIIADIEYALDLIGPDHVGLGSDLFGFERAPKGLEDISKLPALTDALAQRGHSDEVILKILGGNYLRVFEKVWSHT